MFCRGGGYPVVNRDFKGYTFVDVNCNEYCFCDVRQYDPVCEVTVVLSFPEFNGTGSGYNEEVITAVNGAYPEDHCEREKLTNWGCISHGSAWLATETDINESQELYIPDASNSDVTFTVKYHDSVFDVGQYDPIEDASEVEVFVNSKRMFNFKHERDITNLWEGDSMNDDYASEMRFRIACTRECDCSRGQLAD